jgi:hypothetical protein
MVKIPRIEPMVRQVTEQAPTRRIARDELTPSGQLIQEAGRTISGIGAFLEKVRTEEEKLKGQNFYLKTIEEINLDAINDPDTSEEGLKRYQARLTKARTDAMGMISIPFERDRFNLEIQQKEIVAGVELQRTFAKKSLDKWRVEYEKLMEQTTDRETAFRTADEAAQKGAISYEKAEEDKQKWDINNIKFKIYDETATQEKDSFVLNELKKGEEGIYKYLTTGTRLELIEVAQRRIFQNNQKYKRDLDELRNVKHNNILDKISTNTLTFKDIENEMAIPEEEGGVPKKILVSYQKGLQGGIENDLKKIISEKRRDRKPTVRATEAKKYLDLIDNFIDDNVDLWRAREILANAYADGIVNPQEAKLLNQIKQNLEDIEWNRQSGKIKSAIEGLKQRLKIQSNPTDEELALRIKQLLGGIVAGKDVLDMSNQIISDQIETDLDRIRTEKYREGDKRVINGKTYIRNKEGQWMSQ